MFRHPLAIAAAILLAFGAAFTFLAFRGCG